MNNNYNSKSNCDIGFNNDDNNNNNNNNDNNNDDFNNNNNKNNNNDFIYSRIKNIYNNKLKKM